MDQILSYLNRPPVIQYFVSNSPSSSLLLWASTENLSDFKCVMIRQSDVAPHYLELSVLWALNKAGVKIQQVYYAFHDQTIRVQVNFQEVLCGDINNQKIAEKFAQKIGIPFDHNPTQKLPNNPEMIKDPFHQWSRKFFGNTIKIDIDALAIQDNRIVRILEIKRSPKVPVGRWVPYENDQNNYVLLAALARRLKVPLRVIHHSTDPNSFQSLSPDIEVDLFEYFPEENKDFDFKQFCAPKNRKVVPLAQAI